MDYEWVCAGCGSKNKGNDMAWSYYSEGYQRFYCGEDCIKRAKGRI